jgi:ABC-type metal ion transport system, permease component
MFTTPDIGAKVWDAALDSLYMISVSSVLTVLIGVPLAVILVVTQKGHIMENPRLNGILGLTVNFIRSIPFPVFIIFVMPVTKALVGTKIGSTAAIVPLTLAAIVFMARLAETALLEVPGGLIEAAQAAGAGKWQIIRHVLLPEARSGLILAITILVITLISYSAMAGTVGGGGLGTLAINYGYQRYQADVMIICVLLLSFVVQAIQHYGEKLARNFNKR